MAFVSLTKIWHSWTIHSFIHEKSQSERRAAAWLVAAPAAVARSVSGGGSSVAAAAATSAPRTLQSPAGPWLHLAPAHLVDIKFSTIVIVNDDLWRFCINSQHNQKVVSLCSKILCLKHIISMLEWKIRSPLFKDRRTRTEPFPRNCYFLNWVPVYWITATLLPPCLNHLGMVYT